MNRYKIVKLGECEEEYFVDTKQKIIDYDDYLEIGTVATMSNKQVLNILNENEKLSKEKKELENKLKIYEHELNCCDGLYASDNEEFEDYFRLDFSNIISKW